jgi:hypothetical protein
MPPLPVGTYAKFCTALARAAGMAVTTADAVLSAPLLAWTLIENVAPLIIGAPLKLV